MKTQNHIRNSILAGIVMSMLIAINLFITAPEMESMFVVVFISAAFFVGFIAVMGTHFLKKRTRTFKMGGHEDHPAALAIIFLLVLVIMTWFLVGSDGFDRSMLHIFLIVLHHFIFIALALFAIKRSINKRREKEIR
jgi:hypothetical protein